jgi:hypothetical protein
LTVFNYPQKSLQWQLQAKGIQEEQDEKTSVLLNPSGQL